MPISGPVLGAWSLEDRRRLLVLTEGRLLVHSLQTGSSVTLQSVSGLVSAHPAAGDTVLAVTEAGDLYTLDIAADTASLVTVPAARVSAVSGTSHHTCLLDPAGHVWARGAPPQVCPTFIVKISTVNPPCRWAWSAASDTWTQPPSAACG